MKNEYLWDRSGSDPEIERFEDLLVDYRYSPAAPPELPATNIIRFEKRRPRWRFGLIFAASASLALLILAGVWLRGGETPANSAISAAEVPNASSLSIPRNTTSAPVAGDTRGSRTESRQSATVSQVRNAARPVAARFTRKHKTNREPALTAEEKFAFGQLMLALSITSSKLQLVRHTIDNIEAARPGPVVIDK